MPYVSSSLFARLVQFSGVIASLYSFFEGPFRAIVVRDWVVHLCRAGGTTGNSSESKRSSSLNGKKFRPKKTFPTLSISPDSGKREDLEVIRGSDDVKVVHTDLFRSSCPPSLQKTSRES